jgi:hypothetical protein
MILTLVQILLELSHQHRHRSKGSSTGTDRLLRNLPLSAPSRSESGACDNLPVSPHRCIQASQLRSTVLARPGEGSIFNLSNRCSSNCVHQHTRDASDQERDRAKQGMRGFECASLHDTVKATPAGIGCRTLQLNLISSDMRQIILQDQR